MSLPTYFFLMRRSLGQHPLRSVASTLSIGVATLFLFLLTSLGGGLVWRLLPKIEAAFPEKELIVRPGSSSIAFVKIQAKNLNVAAIETIRAMDGVEWVFPLLPIRVPISAEATMGEMGLQTEVVAYGAPEIMFAEAATHRRGFSYIQDSKIPVIVSEYFIDIYNMGLAESQGLPQVTRGGAIGREFKLHLGGGSALDGYSAEGRIATFTCVVVGTTERSNPIGVIIPMEHAREINLANPEPGPEYYNQAFVQVRALDRLEPVAEAIRAMNLEVVDSQDTLRRVRMVIRVGLGVLGVMALAIVTLALFGLFNAFTLILNERHLFIAVMRSLGAGREAMRGLLIGEAMVTGSAGAIGGCALGQAIAMITNARIRGLGEYVSLLDQDLLLLGPLPWALGLVVPLAGALAVASILVWRKTGHSPSRLMGGAR